MQKMLTITVQPFEGSLAENTKEAVKLAMRLNCNVEFTHEGEKIVANPVSDFDKIIAEANK